MNKKNKISKMMIAKQKPLNCKIKKLNKNKQIHKQRSKLIMELKNKRKTKSRMKLRKKMKVSEAVVTSHLLIGYQLHNLKALSVVKKKEKLWNCQNITRKKKGNKDILLVRRCLDHLIKERIMNLE